MQVVSFPSGSSGRGVTEFIAVYPRIVSIRKSKSYIITFVGEISLVAVNRSYTSHVRMSLIMLLFLGMR